jgi:galactokinase
VIDFRAFDVELRYAASKDWMNYDEAMTMMQQVGIPYCVPLRRGTLMECFGFDIQINSTIPKSLGLPALQKNQMEGIVIKSINNYTIPGKRPEYRLRAIFKKKNSKFEEVNPPISSTLYEQRVRSAKDHSRLASLI